MQLQSIGGQARRDGVNGLTDWIQALSALAMVLLTAGLILLSFTLAAITGWYAWSTKRMADVMVKDYESKISPMLEGPEVSWMHTVGEAKALIKLGNLGQTPVVVKSCEITTWHKEIPADKNSKTFDIDQPLLPETPLDVVKACGFLHQELLPPGKLDLRKLKTSYAGNLYYRISVAVYSLAEPAKIHIYKTEPTLAFS